MILLQATHLPSFLNDITDYNLLAFPLKGLTSKRRQEFLFYQPRDLACYVSTAVLHWRTDPDLKELRNVCTGKEEQSREEATGAPLVGSVLWWRDRACEPGTLTSLLPRYSQAGNWLADSIWGVSHVALSPWLMYPPLPGLPPSVEENGVAREGT